MSPTPHPSQKLFTHGCWMDVGEMVPPVQIETMAHTVYDQPPALSYLRRLHEPCLALCRLCNLHHCLPGRHRCCCCCWVANRSLLLGVK
jgi:hypothetical protein